MSDKHANTVQLANDSAILEQASNDLVTAGIRTNTPALIVIRNTSTEKTYVKTNLANAVDVLSLLASASQAALADHKRFVPASSSSIKEFQKDINLFCNKAAGTSEQNAAEAFQNLQLITEQLGMPFTGILLLSNGSALAKYTGSATDTINSIGALLTDSLRQLKEQNLLTDDVKQSIKNYIENVLSEGMK